MHFLKMAHVVRPWILAALLIFALFTNKRVTGVISYSSSELFNLRDQSCQMKTVRTFGVTSIKS